MSTLAQDIGPSAAAANDMGLGAVGAAAAWEGICGVLLASPLP